jgi:hypothetical protein
MTKNCPELLRVQVLELQLVTSLASTNCTKVAQPHDKRLIVANYKFGINARTLSCTIVHKSRGIRFRMGSLLGYTLVLHSTSNLGSIHQNTPHWECTTVLPRFKAHHFKITWQTFQRNFSLLANFSFSQAKSLNKSLKSHHKGGNTGWAMTRTRSLTKAAAANQFINVHRAKFLTFRTGSISPIGYAIKQPILLG